MAAPRHRPLAVLAAALALALALPAAAQEPPPDAGGPSAKDRKRAAALVEDNAVYKKLAAPEQRAVTDYLSFQESLIDEEIDKASLRWLEGATLAELEESRKGGALKRCDPVLSQESCVDKKQPPLVKWDSKRVDMKPFSELFADNEWEIFDASDQAKQFAQDVDKVVRLVRAQGGRIDSVSIFSSANTMANGGKAYNLTHEELSKRRAQTARDLVKKLLAQAGVAAPDDARFALDFKGTNENGTSGPSSPYKCRREKKFCPDGDGPPPSKKKMLEYLSGQKDADVETPKDAEIRETPEPDPDSGAARPALETAPIKELGKDGKDTKAPVPAAGGKCVAPAPTTVWDLYPAYYYQFKYVRVSFVVSYPVPVTYDQPPTRECKARELVVCAHVRTDERPPVKRRPPKKYRLKRVGHFLKCLFRKKGPCPDFECRF